MTDEQIDEMNSRVHACETGIKDSRAIVRSYLQPELSERTKFIADQARQIVDTPMFIYENGQCVQYPYGGHGIDDAVTRAEQILAEVQRREGGK